MSGEPVTIEFTVEEASFVHSALMAHRAMLSHAIVDLRADNYYDVDSLAVRCVVKLSKALTQP